MGWAGLLPAGVPGGSLRLVWEGCNCTSTPAGSHSSGSLSAVGLSLLGPDPGCYKAECSLMASKPGRLLWPPVGTLELCLKLPPGMVPTVSCLSCVLQSKLVSDVAYPGLVSLTCSRTQHQLWGVLYTLSAESSEPTKKNLSETVQHP